MARRLLLGTEADSVDQGTAAGHHRGEHGSGGHHHQDSGGTDGCCAVVAAVPRPSTSHGDSGAAPGPGAAATTTAKQRPPHSDLPGPRPDSPRALQDAHTAQPLPPLQQQQQQQDKLQQRRRLELQALLDGDPSQPLALRVGLLGPELYWQWAHRPVPGQPRFFAHPLLEACTKTPWWLVPLLWLPLFLGCLAHAWRAHPRPWELAAHLVLGVLCWQLLEYAIHRFVFHARPRSYLGITLHFLLHGNHHKFPADPLRLVFPPLPASLLVLAVWRALHAVLPPRHAVPLFAGMGVGYVAYDCMHYAMHHAMGGLRRGEGEGGGSAEVETEGGGRARRQADDGARRLGRGGGSPVAARRWLRWCMRDLWRRHMQHHYRDAARAGGNFGISGSIWDRALGTSL